MTPETNKLYLMAIRALPDDWIREDTTVSASLCGEMVIAACPDYPPMLFDGIEWSPMELYEKST